MLTNLEMIRLLRNTGEPLYLTVKEDGFKGVVITRDGGSSIEVKHINYRDAVHELEKILFNYPHNVTIDDELVDQAPFVDLARATITTYPGDDQENIETNTMRFGHQSLSYHNALVGGVLCSLNEKRAGRRNLKYFAIDDERSGGEHWKKLKRVEISGVMVIDSPDIDRLKQKNQGQIEMPSDLEERVLDEVQKQIKRTMERPGFPVKYEGPVFHKVISLYEDHHFLTGAPIAVITGTPLEITNQDERNAEHYSAAQAFYQSNSILVPVHLDHKQNLSNNIPHLILDEFRFEVTQLDGSQEQISADQSQQPRPARYVKDVTLVYRTEDRHFVDENEEKDDETLEWRIPTTFFMGGSGWENRDIRVVPNHHMSQEELTQHLALAYWCNFEEHSWDEVKQQRDDLGQWAQTEAKYLENPQDGLLQEASEWLNRFSTDYPMPLIEVNITSNDGRMTVILHPQEAPQTEPVPAGR